MRDLDPSTSVLAYFGAELRRRRMAAGLSQERFGKKCQASGSLVRMIETAQRAPKREFTESADTALGTGGSLADLLPLIGQEGHPTWFRPFAEHEAGAATLRVFEPLAVPGLLQTEDYARALLRITRPDHTDEQVEELVTARMERQAILDRPSPPALIVLVEEGVLSRVVGSPKIMADQLDRLIAASATPTIALQVVPWSNGASAALGGTCTIASSNGNDVVYFEGAATGQLVDRAEEVEACALCFDMLRAEALPRTASVELIRKRKKESENNEVA